MFILYYAGHTITTTPRRALVLLRPCARARAFGCSFAIGIPYSAPSPITARWRKIVEPFGTILSLSGITSLLSGARRCSSYKKSHCHRRVVTTTIRTHLIVCDTQLVCSKLLGPIDPQSTSTCNFLRPGDSPACLRHRGAV